MNRKYVVYVHTSPHFSPTELFVWADDEVDAIDIVADMVKALGGDIKKAHAVTVELDD